MIVDRAYRRHIENRIRADNTSLPILRRDLQRTTKDLE
jgi:hypothetical protein